MKEIIITPSDNKQNPIRVDFRCNGILYASKQVAVINKELAISIELWITNS